MQIVANIPKEIYDNCVKGFIDAKNEHLLISAMANSTVVPKDHGGLISANQLKADMIRYGWRHPDCTASEYVEDFPKVVEEPQVIKGISSVQSEIEEQLHLGEKEYELTDDASSRGYIVGLEKALEIIKKYAEEDEDEISD